MKQLVLVSLMLIAGRVLGQTTAAQSNPFLMKIDEMGRVLPNVGKDNVKGFPFLHEVTAKGWVKLKNGNRVSGFDLQVDLYNNALYFIFNGQYYQFAEPVAECQLAFPDNDDSLCNLPLFRTGCKYTNEQIFLRCHLETETSSAEEQLARDTDEPRRISNCAVLFVRRFFCSYSLCIMP